MSAYALTREERELLIRWDEAERMFHVYTTSQRWITRFDRFAARVGISGEQDGPHGRKYLFPRLSISANAPRVVSEAQRAAMAANATARFGVGKSGKVVRS